MGCLASGLTINTEDLQGDVSSSPNSWVTDEITRGFTLCHPDLRGRVSFQPLFVFFKSSLVSFTPTVPKFLFNTM